jgi:hypothetical protein
MQVDLIFLMNILRGAYVYQTASEERIRTSITLRREAGTIHVTLPSYHPSLPLLHLYFVSKADDSE